MRKPLTAFLPFLMLAFSPSIALAQATTLCSSSRSGTGILTGVAEQFHTATAPWTTTALGYAREVFFALVAIEIAWSGITYVLQKDSLPDFLAALLLKLLSVGFFFILLQPEYGPAWISDIVSSFMQAGSGVSGEATFQTSDPSAIFGCGTDIAGAMLKSLSGHVFTFNLLDIIEAFLTALLCALGVVIAFAIAAGQLLITLIESYIVIGGGVFMLGFTGSRWTLVFGEKYIGYVFSVGIKLFMLELVVGVGYGLGRQWAAIFGNAVTPPPEAYLEVVGAALIFALLAWQIPGLAAALMNGAPRMTLGGALSTAGAAAVSGAVVVAGVTSLVAGASAVVGKLAALHKAAQAGGSPQASGFGVNPMNAASAKPQGSSGFSARGAPRDRLPPANAEAEEAHEIGVPPVPPMSTDDVADAASTAEEAPGNESAPHGDAPGGGDVSAGEGETQARDAPESSVVSNAPNNAASRTSASGKKPARSGFRMPPVPDDSADGSIHIRFKHPE